MKKLNIKNSKNLKFNKKKEVKQKTNLLEKVKTQFAEMKKEEKILYGVGSALVLLLLIGGIAGSIAISKSDSLKDEPKTQIKESKKSDSKKEESVKEEKEEESKVDQESTKDEDKKKDDDNLFSDKDEKKSGSSEKKSNNSSNGNKKNNTPTNTQNNQSNQSQPTNNNSTPSQPKTQTNTQPVRELTAWEKLGISEYAYYNTPEFSWERVDFKSNDQCNAWIERKYNEEKIIGGSYRIVNGKYTRSQIGCMVYGWDENGTEYTPAQIGR